MSQKTRREIRFSILVGIRTLADLLKATKILSFYHIFTFTFFVELILYI